MLLDQEENENNSSLLKFENMMKSDKVLFFDSDEFEEIIYHYIDIGKMQLAKKALTIALSQHPSSPSLMLIKAEILIHDDKLDQAEKLLNNLTKIDPNNDEIYIQKSNIFSKKGQHDLAIKALEIALDITEDKSDIYHIIGMEYMFMDDLEQAKKFFILCLDDDIEDHSALYNVVYCYEFLDQFEEALIYLDTFINKNPYSEVAWHQKGRMACYLKKYSLAYNCFDYASLIDENFLGAVLEKAKMLQKMKRYEDAIQIYKSTFNSGEPTSYTYLRIGRCYKKLKNDKMALIYLYKASNEDPFFDKAWRELAKYYHKKKDFNKSLYYINKAIHIESGHYKSWQIFVDNHLVLNNEEDVVYGFEQLLNTGDFELEDFLIYVDVLVENEKIDLAITILEIGLNYYKDHIQINYRLIGLYLLTEKLLLSKDLLEITTRLFPIDLNLLYEIYPNLCKSKTADKILSKYKI
jgi:tetratricopeptide (TPR) repeat protein